VSQTNNVLVRQILRSFLAGYSIGTVALRSRNDPPVTIKEAHIIETIDLLTKTNDNINLKIAHALANNESTLSIAIKNLVKKEYIYRKQGAIDKRNVYLFNSEKAKNVLHNQTEFHFAHKARLLHNFSVQELDLMLRPVFLLVNTLNERIRTKFPQYFLLKDAEFINLQDKPLPTKADYFYDLFVKAFYAMVQVSEMMLNNMSPRLTIAELVVLKFINSYDVQTIPVSNSLMSFVLKLSNSTISITLNKLEEKRLIKRSFDDQDRRSVLISLTAKGNKSITQNYQQTLELFKPLLEQTNSIEQKLLLKLFINMYDFFTNLKF
jgi:DNA-binding MarR family transcriptional regulator